MRILLVADVSIAKVIGGAERVLFEQSTRLARLGHDVHILTRRIGQHTKTRDTISGVNEWRYEADLNKNTLLFLADTYRNSKKVFEALQKEFDLELIIFHQPFSSLAVIHSPFSKRIKKIYTCLSFSFEEFLTRNIPRAGLLQKSLYRLNIHTRKRIEARILKSCDEIVVLSQFTRHKLWNVYQIPQQKVSVIPGGIDLEKFRPTNAKAAIRKQLGLPTDKVILFTVRNLVPRMGLENLIKALEHSVRRASEVYLVLGGDGPLKADLISLARNRSLEGFIRFTGFIPEKQLPLYYQMADLFVLPTKELEGFGLVTLEAMACGLPVVGTPIGGTKEILGKFNPGFLFGDAQPDSIVKLILEKYLIIKNDPLTWRQISGQCRKFVEKHYSWKQNIDSLEQLIQKLIN